MFLQTNNQAQPSNQEQANPPQGQLSTGRRSKNQQQPKKQKESIKLRADHFESKKGLRALYQKTKALKLDDRSEINVQNTMKQIVFLLKSWHFQMIPKYSFDLFLQRCQALGTEKHLSTYMSKVRRIHKGTDTWEEANPEQKEGQEQKQAQVEEDIYPSRMQEQAHQAIEFMNGMGQSNKMMELDEEDRQFMELMDHVQNKHKKEKNVSEDEANDPYVPQGYEFDFSEGEN